MIAPEKWRPIPGYPSYEASDRGNVRRSVPGRGTHAGRVLTPQPGGGREGKYLRVRLSEGGRPQTRLVHILVALAWLGPKPAPGYHVDHVDTDTENNAPDNLRWLPGDENARRGSMGRWHGDAPWPTLPEKPWLTYP